MYKDSFQSKQKNQVFQSNGEVQPLQRISKFTFPLKFFQARTYFLILKTKTSLNIYMNSCICHMIQWTSNRPKFEFQLQCQSSVVSPSCTLKANLAVARNYFKNIKINVIYIEIKNVIDRVTEAMTYFSKIQNKSMMFKISFFQVKSVNVFFYLVMQKLIFKMLLRSRLLYW